MATEFEEDATAAVSRTLSATSNPAEALAQSLTLETPKITTAVKAYMSLVAARSLCSTPTDTEVTSAKTNKACVQEPTKQNRRPLATFHKSADANKASMWCARVLLATINQTLIPEEASELVTKKANCQHPLDDVEKLENSVIRIVWNGLVKKSISDQSTGSAAAQTKPSKVLGRLCLVQAFPHVLRQLRQQQEKNPGEADDKKAALQTKLLAHDVPVGVDMEKAIDFFEEFGSLLTSRGARGVSVGKDEDDDDGALLWARDGGAAELQRRRERRKRRSHKTVKEAEERITGKMEMAMSELMPSRKGQNSTVTIEVIEEEEVDMDDVEIVTEGK